MKMALVKTVPFRALVALVFAGLAATAVAAPTKAGNLLVTDLNAGTLTEYTQLGSVVQKFSIPWSYPNFADLRDVVQGTDGRIHMFNGTFSPWMSTLDPTTGGVSNLSYAGWSTINNVSYGGIAVSGQYVFVSDMSTYGGEASGIVRFDLINGSATRFASGYSFDDLTLGLNGKLYAGGSVFDPATMSLLGTTPWMGAGDVRGRAVDVAGNIYSASWDGKISKHSASGLLIATLSTGENLTDIDINSAGNIVVGSRFGNVYLMDSNLSNFSSFQVGESLGPTVHVAFTTGIPEPSSYALLLVGLMTIAAVKRRRAT